MSEYLKYAVSIIISNEEEEFDTLEQALLYKDKMKNDIMRGYYDLEINEDQILFSSSDTFDTMEKKREQLCTGISLYRCYYTPSGVRKLIVPIDDNDKEIFDSNKITIDISGDSYTVKLNRKDDVVYVPGGMICDISPWIAFDIPLQLSVCICPDGSILHRGWSWDNKGSYYLQSYSRPEEVNVTEEMIDTVNGLSSGRIKFEGLRLNIGRTVQEICPINIQREEELTGNKIFLA